MPAVGYVVTHEARRCTTRWEPPTTSPPPANGSVEILRHASAYEGAPPMINAKSADRLPSYDEMPEDPRPTDGASAVGDDVPHGHGGHQPMPEWMQRCTPACLHKVDALLLLTVLGAVIGILAGSLLRLANPSPLAIELLGFPGEIMLRLLKLLVLPLIAFSMISGVCSLRDSSSGMAKLAWYVEATLIAPTARSHTHGARYTFAYYAISTALAVLLGIVLVLVIQPGRGQPLAGGAALGCGGPGEQAAAAPIGGNDPAGPVAAMLGVMRSLFPDNLVAAAVRMNILGVIVFSLLFGVALSSLGMLTALLTVWLTAR